MSHVNHFLDAVASRGYEHFRDTKGWGLSLIQSNYMTWSLTAGLFSTNQHPNYFRPSREHLNEAQTVLEKMDFVINLDYPNKRCNEVILDLIRIKKSNLTSKSNSYNNGYQKDFHQVDYKRLNKLDNQLYEHTNRIIELDCAFFHQLQL